MRLIFSIGLAAVVFLTVVALIVWSVKSCDSAEEPEKTQTQPEEVAMPAAKTPVQPPEPVKKTVEPIEKENMPVKTAPQPQTAVSADINKRAMQVYSGAASAMQKKNYENACKALRLFFEGLQIPPTHPLYNKACTMLSEASMAIYASGRNPADWTEYTVVPGDNLSRLAKKFDTEIQAITEANHMSGNGLRVGQKLKIPQSSWRIRLDRKNQRILLDNNGRLFKIYSLDSGLHGDEIVPGIYRIKKYHNPDRLLFVSGHRNNENSHAVPLYSSDDTAVTKDSALVLHAKDWHEIFRLITDKTTVEITR